MAPLAPAPKAGVISVPSEWPPRSRPYAPADHAPCACDKCVRLARAADHLFRSLGDYHKRKQTVEVKSDAIAHLSDALRAWIDPELKYEAAQRERTSRRTHGNGRSASNRPNAQSGGSDDAR